MLKLKVSKSWPAPNRILKPGEYSIPSEVTKANAKACRADGCGEIIDTEAAKKAPEPFRKVAPENKKLPGSPERKSKVD
jgi:hypothetical protein